MTNTKTISTENQRPAVTVDVLVFTVMDDQLMVALIKRGIAPYKGSWAIPGGFVHLDESLEEAARREIEEEAGVTDVFLEQLYTFGNPKRDPRMRVVTVAYYALVPGNRITLAAATDAAEASWFPVSKLPPLAFDHQDIMQCAIERLKSKLEYSNIAYSLLPPRFRLSDLQKVYEVILGTPLDKRNFRKKILSLNLVEATGKMDTGGAHRPAQLYRFKKRKMIVFS
ncbi:MAG: NUDIX domain-containing protein [Abitibacteriaceae bacterium]|nr:NUDIX domain-containing protein [Abditibacteriaceae bacterium]